MSINKKENDEETKKIDLVKKTIDKLLKLMGTDAKADVFSSKEDEAIMVNVKTDDEAGLLIGNRGLTLDSIQTILGMIYQKEIGEWQRILVNIADWREKEKERLIALAEQASQRARTTGEPQTLYNLNSSQRRTIHLFLSEDKNVETESVGEGKDRYLVITPKK